MTIELALASLALICLAVGVWLGFRSVRYSEGPATAPRRKVQALVGAFLILGPWLGLWLWLHETVPGWPEAYGSTCRRKCMIEEMFASPGLLEGGWREIALFAQIWSMPAFVVGTLTYLFVRKRGIFQNRSEQI